MMRCIKTSSRLLVLTATAFASLTALTGIASIFDSSSLVVVADAAIHSNAFVPKKRVSLSSSVSSIEVKNYKYSNNNKNDEHNDDKCSTTDVALHSSSSSSLATAVTRGGAGAADNSSSTKQPIISATYFLVMDIGLRKLFRSKNIAFPSQLAGCITVFVGMVLAELAVPGVGDSIFDVLSPGAGLITKWLPVFFVPGLAGLPLAPSMGSPLEVAKTLGVVVIGFFFSLITTTYTVLGLRKFQGAVTEAPTTTVAAPSSTGTPNKNNKAFSDEILSFLIKGTVISAAVSIGATRSDFAYKTPLQTIFLGFATVASYVWGARFPPEVTKFLHPILTSTGLTFVALQLTGLATGSTFIDVLKQYKCGSLAILEAGAGDIILSLLGPAVISFSIAMYSRKGLLATNLPTVLTGMIMGSVGSMFGTAAFVRAIGLGGSGSSSNSCFLRLSTIPRNVTTALAMVISKMLGGDMSISASLVVLTGMFAAMVGGKTLDAWGVTDPVSRGLGIGAAGQSLGSASISHEKDAFPFAALNLVLVAVFATILTSIPAINNLLTDIACGGSS